jgi:hypothetical protein
MENLQIEEKPDSQDTQAAHGHHGAGKNRLLKLSLGALGVVFGTLGESKFGVIRGSHQQPSFKCEILVTMTFSEVYMHT